MDNDADLSQAHIYVEVRETPIAGGRWYVLPDDSVLYERPATGVLEPSTISAELIRSSSSWTQLPSQS
ncbi:hypothetical protein OG225_41175 (plasmid) [Nocardia sp. NBC_01377]|uniref:hypothetical protein n=1 Tax=Nocardia sp. NBC_01377 TaxID=2903595 RepID=UPI002F9094DA